MINDRWLIALAKCRQIARQMRPSFGIDAVIGVLIDISGFDRKIDGVFRWKTIRPSQRLARSHDDPYA